MSTDQFVTALRGGELFQQQVLVDGAIVERPAVSETNCSPGLYEGQRCSLGQLEGSQPPIAIETQPQPTNEDQASPLHTADQSAWRYWSFPELPIHGNLVLSVSSGGQVEYLGRVRPTDSALTWSVQDALQVELALLGSDELLLVDGWLTGIGGILDCIAPPDDIIDSLPNRWCANAGWLMDAQGESPLSTDAGDHGIELQWWAYYQFAPAPDPQISDAGDPQARHGVYALGRRLEGWCQAGQAPCWKWVVVGRLAPDPADFDGPARSIECGHISSGTNGSSSTSGIAMTLLDETGMASDCLASWGAPADAGVIVENPLPNAVTLEVSWSGTMCDLSAELSLERAATGYALDGTTESEPCADDSVVRHQLMIGMVKPVPADSVRVSIDGEVGDLPASTTAPEPIAIPCTTTDRRATVLDETGYIDACVTIAGTQRVDVISLANYDDIGITALRVMWMGSACDDAPVFHLRQTGMRYALDGELGQACGPEDVPYEIQLTLNTDLPAEAVDASLTRGD